MAEENNLFDAPIPGQSLTTEVGARPWQQEPMYSTVEEAFEYYATRVSDPEINEPLLLQKYLCKVQLWKVSITLMCLFLYCLY